MFNKHAISVEDTFSLFGPIYFVVSIKILTCCLFYFSSLYLILSQVSSLVFSFVRIYSARLLQATCCWQVLKETELLFTIPISGALTSSSRIVFHSINDYSIYF
jgi:hypothetical protein